MEIVQESCNCAECRRKRAAAIPAVGSDETSEDDYCESRRSRARPSEVRSEGPPSSGGPPARRTRKAEGEGKGRGKRKGRGRDADKTKRPPRVKLLGKQRPRERGKTPKEKDPPRLGERPTAAEQSTFNVVLPASMVARKPTDKRKGEAYVLDGNKKHISSKSTDN